MTPFMGINKNYKRKNIISNLTISNVVKVGLDHELLSKRNHTAVFFDLLQYHYKLNELANAFRESTLNAIAIKANPVISILKVAANQEFGAECASMGELVIAKKAGFDNSVIVFDSPTKTANEIMFALENEIYLNIDNEQELEYVDKLIHNGQTYKMNSIGLRINPALSYKDLNRDFSHGEMMTITGMKTSKFGIAYDLAKRILTNESNYKKFLTGLHVHVGSQRCPLQMLILGIKKVVELAELLNNQYGYEILTIDIGGGLPAKYEEKDKVISFKEYSNILFYEIPQLHRYNLITEFGRSLLANLGWVVSKVEYTKVVKDDDDNELKMAMIQIGGDMFVRTVYLNWYHDILLLDKFGSIKEGELIEHSIAGPLCFSGDFIAHKRMLPLVEPGDWIVIKDAGAYTFSMWSYYNNREFPPVYGYNKDHSISILHNGHSSETSALFWE